MEIIKANGFIYALGLFREYMRFIRSKLRRKKIIFEYKSLRKIVDQNSNAYAGTKKMIMLRKGR